MAARDDVVARAVLHDATRIHHRDLVGLLGDHAEVVADEHERHPPFALESCEQLEDLCLNRDVERGGRLVGDEDVRVERERHRDHHALAHAA